MLRIISTLIFTAILAACGGGDSGDGAGNITEGASSGAQAASRIATAMKAPDATLVDLDPCELFTSDDAKPYLDGYRETKQEIRYGMKECRHNGGSFTSVRLELGGMSLDGFEAKVASTHRLMKGVELVEVPGVGDKAYFLRSLWVQSGDYILHIDVNSVAVMRDDTMTNKRNQSVEIARKVLAGL